MNKVSVLIPSYNQENVIEETLSSALNQTYKNIEVVIADDASKDGTPTILEKWQQRYPQRIKVFLHENNVGVTKNHNRGLYECTGDFVVFLDGDDVLLPNKIEEQLAFMQANPDCSLSYHDVEVFDSLTGENIYLWSERIGTKQGELRNLIRFGNFLPAVGVMVRRKDIPLSGYDERIPVYSDWLFWLRILERGKGKICYLPSVQARYRRHEANMTNKFPAKFHDQNFVLDIVEEEMQDFRSEVNARRSELYFMQAINDFSNGRFVSMLKFLYQSLRVSFPRLPWVRLVWREINFMKKSFFVDHILRSIAHD